MNSALHFTVPEPIPAASQKANVVIQQIGAPIRTDSGHYLTGVIPAYAKNVDVRISWLATPEGTQLTVTASHEELDEEMLLHVAERFRNTYRQQAGVKQKNRLGPAVVNTVAIFLSAVAVMAFFLFILMHHH